MNNDKRLAELVAMKNSSLMCMKDLLYTNNYEQLQKAMDNYNYIKAEIYSITPSTKVVIPDSKLEGVQSTAQFVKYTGPQQPSSNKEYITRTAMFQEQADFLRGVTGNSCGGRTKEKVLFEPKLVANDDVPRKNLFSLFVPEQNEPYTHSGPIWTPTPLVENKADTLAMPYKSKVGVDVEFEQPEECVEDISFNNSILLPAYEELGNMEINMDIPEYLNDYDGY